MLESKRPPGRLRRGEPERPQSGVDPRPGREDPAHRRRLLGALRSETGPTAEEARQTLRSLRETVDRAEESLDALGGTLSGHDDTRLTATRALEELTRTMQALRNLVDYIQTHPEAVVLGKEQAKEKK